MRVTDLSEMTAIDSSIQRLLSELQELYSKRQSIVDPKKRKGSKSKADNDSQIDTVLLDDIDLSLNEQSSFKRFGIFTSMIRH